MLFDRVLFPRVQHIGSFAKWLIYLLRFTIQLRKYHVLLLSFIIDLITIISYYIYMIIIMYNARRDTINRYSLQLTDSRVNEYFYRIVIDQNVLQNVTQICFVYNI